MSTKGAVTVKHSKANDGRKILWPKQSLKIILFELLIKFNILTPLFPLPSSLSEPPDPERSEGKKRDKWPGIRKKQQGREKTKMKK